MTRVSANERGGEEGIANVPERDHLGFDFVVNDNTPLNVTWSKFETPIIQYTTIESDGYGEENLFLL
jgi:dipeptidyl aminopeptidase